MTDKIATEGDAGTKGVAFRYEVQDFIEAYRLAVRPGPKRAAALAAAIALLVGALFWYEPAWDVRAQGCAGGALGGVGVFLLHRYLYLPWHARRQFANYPLLRAEHVFTLEQEGLRDSTERTNALLVWRDFVGWRANDKSVLLYTSPRLFILAPTRLAQLGFPIEDLKGALARDFAKRG